MKEVKTAGTPGTSQTIASLASASKTPTKRSSLWTWLGLAAVAVVGYGGYRMMGKGGSGSVDAAASLQTHKVTRGVMRVTVTEDGNVESARNDDVKCTIQGGSNILWIIEEGKVVTKGTELVKLDASLIEEQLRTQRIAYERARSTLIQAEEDLAVKTIAVKEYLEGTYLQALQTAEANIVIANENLRNAENTFEHSERMFRKGYINQLQLEGNRFAVERAKLDRAAAETAKKVLVEFTRNKTVKELESAREAAHAKMLAEKEATNLEKFKLDRLNEQLKACVITAPQDGMVIYANEQASFRSGTSQVIIEEGARVRESQTIIRLPDLTQMQVKALINETKVEKVQPGMMAQIKIRDDRFTGEVKSVASQAEPTKWSSSTVKDYAAIVKIDETLTNGRLKPGMTAEVEIIVQELEKVLTVPLLGVVEIGAKYYCWVKTSGGKFERRVVKIGANNDRFIEIQDGLNEGDEVVLNPRSMFPEARESLETMPDLAFPKRKNGNGNGKGEGSAPVAAGGDKVEHSAGPANGVVAASPNGSNGQSSKKGSDETGKRKGGKRAGKSGGGRGPSMDIMALDQNKDGKVSKEEAGDIPATIFDRIDGNHDGAIDAAEASAAIQRMRERGAGGNREGGGPPQP